MYLVDGMPCEKVTDGTKLPVVTELAGDCEEVKSRTMLSVVTELAGAWDAALL